MLGKGMQVSLDSTLSVCLSIPYHRGSQEMIPDLSENHLLKRATRPAKCHLKIFYWELQEIWRQDPSFVRISDLIEYASLMPGGHATVSSLGKT